MAKRELHRRALELRSRGMSYTQIKHELEVSKSTLSIWLNKYPLSPERIRELRNTNEQRIERIRQTKAAKRIERQNKISDLLANKIGDPSEYQLYIAGLFLYWAEGTKSSRGVVCVTNTDPTMINFFIHWLELQQVKRERMKIKLHLYNDMNIREEINFWHLKLHLPVSSFTKPYVKESSSQKKLNYKGRFGHGTCNLIVNNMQLYEEVLLGIEYIRNLYGGSGIPSARAV